MSLSEELVLVTGASRGIGKAIAHELGRCGATVIGTATSKTGAKSISESLSAQEFKGEGQVLDVTAPDSIKNLLDVISDKFGAVSVLINNAGITRDNLLLRMKEDDWDAVINTNLSSVYRLSKACLRGMMKKRHGRIINIGSIVGVTGNSGQANYAAAKAGVIAFSKSLAQEVGSRGITVNTVAPGFIDTDMTRALPDDQREALLGKIALGRLGKVEDIANAVVFLASAEAAYITGETLHVNGGMYMA
ncbi:MAG: 3-oxoacyl-ACP reductase [Thiothrix sp.]|nr:MAG: 3-oxoacyl-ACP reductase [Thiothrix sp.]